MTLKVLTLNIWNEDGPWPERSKRIREWIDRLDPDLIGLQEVLRGPRLDQLEELLEGRSYHSVWARATDFWGDATLGFGNAVASRWPIAEHAECELPSGDDGERRVVIRARVEAPFGPLLFASTHLNFRFHHGSVRERQVVAACNFVWQARPRDGFPPMLMGDFNAEPESAEIRYVSGLQSLEGRSMYLRDAWTHAGDGGAGITWSNANPYTRPWLEPDRRIDYIFVGPPQRNGVGLIERCQVVCDDAHDGVWPSDHFGILAEVRTAPRPDLD